MTSSTDQRTDQQTLLPLLPVPTVVLPGSVVTIALGTDEARTAIAAATAGDGRLVLVPQVDGRTPVVGVLARVPSTGSLPTGEPAAIVQAEGRALLGTEQPSERAGR